MTITPEIRRAIEQAGGEPVRIEDPRTNAAYVLVREDVYRRLRTLEVADHSDRSLFECGDFRPDR